MSERASMAGILVRANLLLAVAAPIAHAAEPAPADGDIAAYRARLQAQAASGSTPQVQAELDRIATEYGDVTLVADELLELQASPAPIGEGARALEFARASLATKLTFTGLLPVGTYAFGATSFAVQGGSVVVIDVVRPPDIHVAPTCGPCCHGSSQCWEELGPPPELIAPVPDEKPRKKSRSQ